MVGTYNLWLVLLSYVVAVIASFVALDMATRVFDSQNKTTAHLWLAAGSVAMGAGIWSMHFIGMLAFHLPIAVSYDIPITLLSMLFAIGASGFALYVLSGREIVLRRLLSSGMVMGGGIAAMHYTGMAAMEVLPPIRYDPLLFAASVLIAIAASIAALWICSHLRGETIGSALWRKTGSALVMAVAITGMHYTGMAAALFDSNTICYGDPSKLNSNWLAVTVGFCTFLFLTTTLLVAVFDARLTERTLKLAESNRSNEALEARVRERTARIRESEQATLNMMQDAVRSREKTEQAFESLKSEMAERKALEQRSLEQAALLDEARDAIIVRDLEHRILYWNKGAERLYGWTAAEAVGRLEEDLFYPDPADYHATAETLRATSEWSGRLKQRRKDGRAVTIEGHATLVHDDNGQPKSILSINTDITKRLALEEQIGQSQRMDAIGQLTGGVAHDFNNLLTVILGNSELLLEQLAAQPRLRALAEMTRAAAQRGADLTHRLLAFARRQPLEPRIVDAGKLLATMEELLQRTLGENIKVEIVQHAGLCQALVDPSQLENAVLNLCINARDAMPDGGRLILEAGSAMLDQNYADQNPGVVPGGYLMIAVSDTGRGIPPDNLQHVFEPFFTTKEFGKGTGLGLSMVYGFVKQSQGHVSIYSEVGHGTTVKIFLPRVDAADGAQEPISAPEAVTGGTEKILLVEDDEFVRGVGERLLAELGYRVVSAPNGKDALAIIRQDAAIDLLFTDVMMPGGMNGHELAQAARTLRPGLKVLYTSGYTDIAIVHQGGLDQGRYLLNKPYHRADLAKKLRAVLSATAG